MTGYLTDSDSDTDSDAVTVSDADAVTDTDSDAVSDADADAVSDTDTDTDSDGGCPTVTESATDWVTVSVTVPITDSLTVAVCGSNMATVLVTVPAPDTASDTISESETASPTATATVSVSASKTVSASESESVSVSESESESVSVTASETESESVSVTASETIPESVSVSASESETETVSASVSASEMKRASKPTRLASWRLGVFFFGFSSLSPTAHAEPEPLTLERALALAERGNRDLAQARARLDQAAAGVAQAWVALLPQAVVQGKYTHNYKEVSLNLAGQNQGLFAFVDVLKSGVDAATAAKLDELQQQIVASTPKNAVIQPADQLDAALTVTAPLVVPWAYRGLQAARRNLDAAQATTDATKATVLMAAAQAFYAAAGTDELVTARQHGVAVARRTLEDARARLAAGTVNRVEVARAELVAVRTDQVLAEAEDARSAAYRALAMILAHPDPFRVVAVELPPIPEPPPQGLSLRPEFVALQKTLLADDAQIASTRWRWAPTLSAFANARAFNYAGFSGDHYAWLVGAQLDWTIYDGGARDAQRHLALAQRRERQARLTLLEEQLQSELDNARDALRTKRRALVTAERSVELSRETLELVRVQRDVGTASQLDLLQAQDNLITAEVAVAQAHFDLGLADLSHRRAAGTFPGQGGQ